LILKLEKACGTLLMGKIQVIFVTVELLLFNYCERSVVHILWGLSLHVATDLSNTLSVVEDEVRLSRYIW